MLRGQLTLLFVLAAGMLYATTARAATFNAFIGFGPKAKSTAAGWSGGSRFRYFMFWQEKERRKLSTEYPLMT